MSKTVQAKNGKTVVVATRLAPADVKAIKRIAKAKGESAYEIVRGFIERGVAMAEKRRMAVEVRG